MDRLLEYAAIIISAYGIIKAEIYHKLSLNHELKLHNDEVDLLLKNHEKEMKALKEAYLMTSYNDTERHFQQLNADLINSTKEFEKDMVDHRRLWCETLIIAATIMQASLITILIQAHIRGRNFLHLDLYAVCVGGSVGCLFFSIVCFIEIVHRISIFTIQRSIDYEGVLSDSMKKSSTLMDAMRPQNADDFDDNESESSEGSGCESEDNQESPTTLNIENLRQRVLSQRSMHYRALRRKRKIVATMNEQECNDYWRRHEDSINAFLYQREQINDKTATIFSLEKGFEHFWIYRCEFLALPALVLFYLGTSFLILAVIVFTYTEYRSRYHHIIESYLSASLIGIGLFIGLVSVVKLRYDTNVLLDKYKPGESESF